MTTRLPLRIDPLPGEWWRGYLQRIGLVYGVHQNDLLRRVEGPGAADRRSQRWSGIAVTDARAVSLAAVLNLRAEEVHAMQLSAFDGSALKFGDLTTKLDPGFAHSVEALPLRAVGPLVKVTHDRYCPQCVWEIPGYRAMSWRLHVHLVCTRHRIFLKSGPAGVGAGPVVVDEHVDRQSEVLSRLAPSTENASFFAHLEAQLRMLWTGKHGGWTRIVEESPRAALEAFSVAVARVDSPGYPDYQGFGTWSTVKAARFLRAPVPMGLVGRQHNFPHLLPMHVFVRGLSDLLHANLIQGARAIAAVAVFMVATGQELQAAIQILPERYREAAKRRLLKHLIQLDEEGRAEQFWTLCEAAAAELTREDVDYRHREHLCHQEHVYETARAAEPSAYCRTIRTWLVDQWACTYTSHNVRPSVSDGSIEHYDRLYGAGMRVALGRHFEESAA